MDAPALDLKKLWMPGTYGTHANMAPVITKGIILALFLSSISKNYGMISWKLDFSNFSIANPKIDLIRKSNTLQALKGKLCYFLAGT